MDGIVHTKVFGIPVVLILFVQLATAVSGVAVSRCDVFGTLHLSQLAYARSRPLPPSLEPGQMYYHGLMKHKGPRHRTRPVTLNPLVDPTRRFAKAILRNVGLSQIKMLRTISEIKGRPLLEALTILQYSPRRPAAALYKVIKSALANAVQKYGADHIRPRVYTILATRGPYTKKVVFRAKGRADVWHRPRSHTTVILEV